MRPANLLKKNVAQHVPLEDRLAFQSAANEAAHFLLMAASQRAGYHLESIVQVSFLPPPPLWDHPLSGEVQGSGAHCIVLPASQS